MNKIKIVIAVLLATASTAVQAQFSQLGPKNEFMLKIEAGYMPFMGHVGDPGEYGYVLSDFHNGANLNAMAGINISQDWFLGGGLAFHYFHNTEQGLAEPMMGAGVFVDFDFRPIWKGVMGVDYQPTTIKWAPEVGARLGGSLLLNHPDYGSPFSPLAEFYGGINWYYAHGLRNMEHNWHSFYATIGIAYMQQAVFLPIRIGWRW